MTRIAFYLCFSICVLLWPLLANAGPKLDAYENRLQQFMRQLETTPKLVNYRDPEQGRELESLLDPQQRDEVVDEYIDSLQKGEKTTALFNEINKLYLRIATEFQNAPSEFEVELLDALSWKAAFGNRLQKTTLIDSSGLLQLYQHANRSPLALSDAGYDRFSKLVSGVVIPHRMDDRRHVPSPKIVYSQLKTKAEKMLYGEKIYNRNCVACHQNSGLSQGPIKALVGSHSLQDANGLIDVLLRGQNNGAMPGYKSIDDEDLAAIANFVRDRFGRVDSMSIRPSDIAKRR